MELLRDGSGLVDSSVQCRELYKRGCLGRVALDLAEVEAANEVGRPLGLGAIRDSARGEDCLIRLPGCPADPAMTIWSHNRHQRAGKGFSIKAIDLNGAYCCTHCDAIYDGQAPRPDGWTREQVELAWYGAHAESLVRVVQKGLAK